MTLLLIELVVVLSLENEIEELRLVLVGLIPIGLEGLKNLILDKKWPRRIADNLYYGLLVEMVRYSLVVIALLSVTSFLDKEKAIYALLFCGNFFMAIAVNIGVQWGKNN